MGWEFLVVDLQVNVECMNARENRVGIDQVLASPPQLLFDIILIIGGSLSPHLQILLKQKQGANCRRFHWLLLWQRKMKYPKRNFQNKLPQDILCKFQPTTFTTRRLCLQVKDRVDKNLVKENDNIRKYMQQIKVDKKTKRQKDKETKKLKTKNTSGNTWSRSKWIFHRHS